MKPNRNKARLGLKLLYTAKEAAEALTLQETAVMTLYRSGELAAKRLAGTDDNPRNIRFTRTALIDFVRNLPTYDPTLAKGD